MDYCKRVILYLGRAQPVRTLDEIMLELQTVETFNVIIERTETPPYYRLTNLRKASSNLETNNAGGGGGGGSGSSGVAFEHGSVGSMVGAGSTVSLRHNNSSAAAGGGGEAEKGTIHTKRHSQEDPGGGGGKSSGGGEKTELSLAGSLRSAGSMATSAGSAIIQKVSSVFFFLC
jgi:hypothetical protein